MKMTVGVYIRVSKEEQFLEGYSIPAQKEKLMSYCKAMGWDDYKLYVEEGISAKNMNRPKLQLLLEDVKNKRISSVLVYRLDRFTRRVKDLYNMLEILESNNCSFISATEPYDTSSAMGKLFITIVAALAEWETGNLSERVKMALENKVSGGERVGNIPFGFDLNDEEKLIKNDDGKYVMDMIEKYESGWSLNRISNYMNLINNSRNWTATAVLRIFTNPALYGATRWVDKVYEDTHEGYISKERWKKIQLMLEDRGQHFRKDVKSTYLFQGVLCCPNCGSILSVNRFLRKRKNGELYQNAIYKCRQCYENKIKTFQPGEKRVERALIEYMKNVKFENIEVPKNEKDETEIIKSQLVKIEKQREKYQRAWAADLVTDQEFEERMTETRNLYEELQNKLNEKNGSNNVDPEALKKIVFTFRQTYTYLTQEEKKNFIQQFIRKIEFDVIPQPPLRPDKAKTGKGKPKIVIKNIDFY